MANGVPVRDVSGIGADHLNEVDLSNVQQIEIAKGPSSLMYASGTAGGIINIVDGALQVGHHRKQSPYQCRDSDRE
ncbi:MAG: hypothetical protein CM15mP120_23280 [Pseudomonadota bacterium]|nr:MAG: hypothetical protein CM15mP120_23280 [Pseudomonadota bacterium]